MQEQCDYTAAAPAVENRKMCPDISTHRPVELMWVWGGCAVARREISWAPALGLRPLLGGRQGQGLLVSVLLLMLLGSR